MAKATAQATGTMVDVILPGGMVVSMTPEQRDAYMAAAQAKSGAAGRVTIKANRTDTLYDRTDPATKVTAKLPGKGNVGVYGIQRMPITLYPKQWAQLFAMREEIEAVIEANREALSFDSTAKPQGATVTKPQATHSAEEIEAAKRLLGIK